MFSASAAWVSAALPYGVLLLAVYYLYTGISNLWRWRLTSAALRTYRVPFPILALIVGSGSEVAGSLLLATDRWRLAGALVLVAFTIVATAIFHYPPRYPPAERRHHLNMTFNSVALCGGLLVAGTIGPLWGGVVL